MTEAREVEHSGSGTIFAGGIALVGGALAFLAVFTYLAACFNYPDVLDGSAEDVLPALLDTGSTGRAVWSLYSVLPLVFIPAGVSAFLALRRVAAGPMRIGILFAFLASVCMMLGLMRWPSMHWELARAWVASSGGDRPALAAIFDGLNRYLGNFIGEFLGELSFSLFFTLAGIALLRRQATPRWFGWWGIVTGVLGLIGMWRNVTGAVDLVAELNNYLLPAWMIGFGIWLMRASRRRAHALERELNFD